MYKSSRGAFRVVALATALLLPWLGEVRPAAAGGAVGTGVAGSCTEPALDAALAGGGSVTFDCGADPVSIPITVGKVIASDTALDGAGGRVTLLGSGSVRLFDVSPGAMLTLENLTLANGGAFEGGAVLVQPAATLQASRCTFTENASFFGGAVANAGTAGLSNSTLTGNTAGRGAAIFNRSGATLKLFNTTIAGNMDLGEGGAIYSEGGTVHMANTIVANTSGGPNCVGLIGDGGSNLQFPGASCGDTIPEVDPGLDILKDNGGPTQTMALMSGSPAIDNGDPAICAAAPVDGVDQRGEARPALCDIGAFELKADADGDGVTDDIDQCPGTPPDAVVDPADGCSIDQLCPCAGPRDSDMAWRNHGAYVSCVSHAAEHFLLSAVISEEEKDAVVSAAARSKCGAVTRR